MASMVFRREFFGLRAIEHSLYGRQTFRNSLSSRDDPPNQPGSRRHGTNHSPVCEIAQLLILIFNRFDDKSPSSINDSRLLFIRCFFDHALQNWVFDRKAVSRPTCLDGSAKFSCCLNRSRCIYCDALALNNNDQAGVYPNVQAEASVNYLWSGAQIQWSALKSPVQGLHVLFQLQVIQAR